MARVDSDRLRADMVGASPGAMRSPKRHSAAIRFDFEEGRKPGKLFREGPHVASQNGGFKLKPPGLPLDSPPDWKDIPLRDLTFTNIGMDGSFKLLTALYQSAALAKRVGDQDQRSCCGIQSRVPHPDSSGTPHCVSGMIDNIERLALAVIMASVSQRRKT